MIDRCVFAIVCIIFFISACKKDAPAPNDFFVRADKQTISFPARGITKDTIHISSNASWTVVIPDDADFITVEPMSGTGDADIIFSSSTDNTTSAIKTTNVEIKPSSGANSAVVTVLQFAGIQSVLKATFGGEGTDVFNDFAATPDGGYIAVGSTTSTQGDASDAKGGQDLWIVKFDNEGNKQWHKLYGGAGDDLANTIVRTSQNTYLILGSTNSSDGDITGAKGDVDAWLLNINDDGSLIWQKTIGGSNQEQLFNLKPAGNGNFLMSGWTNSSDHDVSSSHGGIDAWLLKVNGDGDITWEKTFGGTNTDVAYDATPVSDGGIIFCGHVVSNDGDLAERPVDSHAAWFVKLNTAGNIAGKVYSGSSEYDNAMIALEAANGDYLFAGETNSAGDYDNFHANRDAFVCRLDASGNFLWKKAYGGSLRDNANDLIESTDGHFLFAGVTSSTDGDIANPLGNEDAWVMKISGGGEIISNYVLGSEANDIFTQVKQLNSTRFALVGRTDNEAWFEVVSFN